MTTTEILALANKVLKTNDLKNYSLALKEKKFTKMRIISEIALEEAKEYLIKNAIDLKCDPSVVFNYKSANDLMNETLEFIIINSEVN
jgi:hypothetical protein